MPEPKKQSSPRKTGLRRSHLRLKLARSVNRHSPVKAFETAKTTPNLKLKDLKKKAEAKKAAKTSDKKSK
jgi:ribosomal protein L32